jgi:hypothetical protein
VCANSFHACWFKPAGCKPADVESNIILESSNLTMSSAIARMTSHKGANQQTWNQLSFTRACMHTDHTKRSPCSCFPFKCSVACLQWCDAITRTHNDKSMDTLEATRFPLRQLEFYFHSRILELESLARISRSTSRILDSSSRL